MSLILQAVLPCELYVKPNYLNWTQSHLLWGHPLGDLLLPSLIQVVNRPHVPYLAFEFVWLQLLACSFGEGPFCAWYFLPRGRGGAVLSCRTLVAHQRLPLPARGTSPKGRNGVIT